MDGKQSQADPTELPLCSASSCGRHRTAGNCSPMVPWVPHWLSLASNVCDMGVNRGLK